MSSTNNKKTPLSMEDFVTGLMLAGYLLPANTSELQQKEQLEKYESSQVKEPKNIYFKRVVLAAEIAFRLHSEATFGRVKFQKLVYLCEYVLKMNLESRYKKQAAGPFDNKFMHTIDKEFAKLKWIAVVKKTDNNIIRYHYSMLENIENYRTYYQRYYGDKNDLIQYVIELFRTKKTSDTELAATVLACYLEMKKNLQILSFASLTQLFYDWADSKKRFSGDEISKSYKWLQEHGLIPEEDML